MKKINSLPTNLSCKGCSKMARGKTRSLVRNPRLCRDLREAYFSVRRSDER